MGPPGEVNFIAKLKGVFGNRKLILSFVVNKLQSDSEVRCSMASIADKLFMGSLILMMVSVVISGVGFQFVNWKSQVTDELEEETKTSSNRKKSVMDRQDKSLKRIWRSYLFWIALVGMLISIGLSYL